MVDPYLVVDLLWRRDAHVISKCMFERCSRSYFEVTLILSQANAQFLMIKNGKEWRICITTLAKVKAMFFDDNLPMKPMGPPGKNPSGGGGKCGG